MSLMLHLFASILRMLHAQWLTVSENKRYVLVNKKTKKKFANYSMSPYLFHALKENKLSISEDFDALSRFGFTNYITTFLINLPF